MARAARPQQHYATAWRQAGGRAAAAWQRASARLRGGGGAAPPHPALMPLSATGAAKRASRTRRCGTSPYLSRAPPLPVCLTHAGGWLCEKEWSDADGPAHSSIDSRILPLHRRSATLALSPAYSPSPGGSNSAITNMLTRTSMTHLSHHKPRVVSAASIYLDVFISVVLLAFHCSLLTRYQPHSL